MSAGIRCPDSTANVFIGTFELNLKSAMVSKSELRVKQAPLFFRGRVDKLGDGFDVLIDSPKILPFGFPTAWLKPVPTASMNTRSALSGRQSALSRTL